MGTVLAMSARGIRPILAIAVAALAGCGVGSGDGAGVAPLGGSAAEARALSVIARAQRVLAGGGSDDAVGAPRAIPGGFSPEAIAADQGAYRFVQINALGISEAARVIQENGGEITLALQSGPTAAFDDGILTATRGFGDDLLTIDAPGLLAALRAGGGEVARRIETLDAQDQVVTTAFACTVTAVGAETVDLGLRQVEAPRLDEACRGERLGFDNIYWLDAAGAIVASRQYVSPSVAYLRANRL